MTRFLKIIILLVCASLPISGCANASNPLTDQQQQFVNLMKSNIQLADQQILKQRDRLLAIEKSYIKTKQIDYKYYEYLFSMGNYYRVNQCKPSHWYPTQCINLLKQRMDILPTNLIIAQAINESDWGQSRFAKQGNNYFGMWCFTKGCGLVPLARPENKTYEVESFKSIEANILAYYRNINTHNAYQNLREMRSKMRDNNQPLDAIQLATGLDQYSARKQVYVRSIQHLVGRLQLTA